MRHQFLSLILIALVTAPVAASIRGTVMTVDGKPISGAKLDAFAVEDSETRAKRLLSSKPHRVPVASATTDAKGNFVVATKSEPFIMLQAEASGYVPAFARLRGEDEIIIALAEGSNRTGTVRANGKPLANALVIWSGRGELTAVTDAEGKYSIADPEKWANRVTVIHPEYAMKVETGGGRFGRKLPLDLTLDKGTTLSGIALGEDGTTPIANAQVAIDGWPVGTTAADGTFTIANVSDKWRDIEITSGTLIGGKSNTKADIGSIKLIKASTISGSVRDLKTQVPLAGAYVTLADSAFVQTDSRSVIADAKGNFSFRSRSGRYRLTASLPGFQVTPATVDVKPRDAVLKSLSGTEEARVTGYALDDTRKPVAAARIAAGVMPMQMGQLFMSGADMPFAAFSGPDGRFIARGLATDIEFELQATKRGFPSAKSEPLKLAPGEKKTGVILTIPRGLEIAGVVKDQNGDPLSEVAVTAEETPQGGGGMMTVRRVIGMQDEAEPVKTNARGEFSLRLKEGKHNLSFQKPGFAPKTLRGRSVSATADPIEVTLSPGVEVRGRVVRADGTGVPDVSINIMRAMNPSSITTSGDGSFTVVDLEPGPTMLMAMKPDEFIQEMRTVTAPESNLVIELPPTGVVSGKVVDKATKNPISSFRVGASGARSTGNMMIVMPPMLKSFTTDDGTFVLDNVRTGAIDLVVQAPGYVDGRLTGLRLEVGRPLSDVVVELETGVKLTGKVTGSDGLALSGVAVTLDSGGPAMSAPRMNAPVVTDANGEYTIEAVAPGEKTYAFTKSGYITEKKEVRLSGKEARLDAKLSKGRDVAGVVVNEAGMPVADVGVTAQSAVQGSTGWMSGSRTDGSGTFKFEGLAPGRYTFRATKSGYSSGEMKDVDIETSGPVRITLKQGGAISGRVLGLAQDELSRASVRAWSNAGGGSVEAPVDASGMYRIEGAPVGSVRVSASVGGFGSSRSTQTKSVQVEAGSETNVDLEFSSDIVIRGHVTRAGKAAVNSMISFTPRQADIQTRATAQIDSKGNYEVSGLEPGEYEVQVAEMRSFTPYNTTYRVSGSATFDIEIRGAAVMGRVIDSETSQPIEDASVTVEAADPNVRSFYRLGATTDAAGRFALEAVPEGKYRLRAQKENYGNQVLEVDITSGRTQDVELRIGRNVGVTLRVIDARDGRALNARFLVNDAMNRTVYDGMPRTNADGDVVLPLEPGTYRATVTAQNYAARMVTMTSPSQGVRIGLTPGGTLIVESSSTKMLRVKLITASGEEYNRFGSLFGPREISIAHGTNRLEHIAPGGYTLQVLNDDGSVKTSKGVSVGEGTVTKVDL